MQPRMCAWTFSKVSPTVSLSSKLGSKLTVENHTHTHPQPTHTHTHRYVQGQQPQLLENSAKIAAKSLENDCKTACAKRLPNDCKKNAKLLQNECQITAKRLPNDCTVTAKWPLLSCVDCCHVLTAKWPTKVTAKWPTKLNAKWPKLCSQQRCCHVLECLAQSPQRDSKMKWELFFAEKKMAVADWPQNYFEMTYVVIFLKPHSRVLKDAQI